MKKFLVVMGLLIILLVIAILWWERGLLSADSTNKTSEIFVVKNGEGVREIANNLKTEKLIRDPIVFFLLTKLEGLDKKIQAGDFRLNPSMSADQIAAGLTHGTLDIWVTIPEGLRADEIADILKAKIPSYNDSWRIQLEASEGYLFPDTYLIPRGADINLVLTLLKNNFQEKFDSIRDSKTTVLTNDQSIVVASIIEKEAKYAEDKPLVASVIMNRLNLGMALQVDPSVSYALGYQTDTKSWWKKELSLDDLKVNSPYNTYLHTGLPPTAISNPGLGSIQAALTPSSTDYLYYFSDKQGHLHFATTMAGHQANIEKYSQ